MVAAARPRDEAGAQSRGSGLRAGLVHGWLAGGAAAFLLEAPEELGIVVRGDRARATRGRAQRTAARGRRRPARTGRGPGGAADGDPDDRPQRREEHDDHDPEPASEARALLGEAPREVEESEDRQRDRHDVDEGPSHPSRVSRRPAYAGRVPVVTYSLLRLGVFVLALIGLLLAGMGGWLLVVVAAVVAAALSYVLFGRQRVAAAQWLADRRAPGAPRFSRAVEEDAEAEDAIADRLREQGSTDDGDGARDDDGDGARDGDGDGPGDQIARPNPSSTP